MHYDVTLTSPHVVRLVLRNAGRQDIARDAFDGGEPLRFDVGAWIVQCLEVVTSPSDERIPRLITEGPVLMIDPVKISRG